MKALLVEDEQKVASFIQSGLESEGFIVDVAFDGEDGLDKAFDDTYDVIILDLMLPKIDGISLLKTIRTNKINTPVLVLTALGSVKDRIEGLNQGADDYLVKPFSFGELLARTRALLRRNQPEKETRLTFNGLHVDLVTHEVRRGDTLIELSAKEYALLEFFIYNTNRALNRITISEHVWHYNFDRGTNFIDVYVNRLRKKIDEGYDKKFIKTVRGYGYMFKYDKYDVS